VADETCWTLVEDAAGGAEAARETFARLYLPVVRAYFAARWAGTGLCADVDDAGQEVFLDLLRPDGALQRVRREFGAGGFRAFLFGVARNVARRHEERSGRRDRKERPLDTELQQQAAVEDAPSRAFDQAWARSLMRAAGRRHARMAEAQGEEAVSRVELLRLRFQEGLPIRSIAALRGVDAARVHHEYSRARREFAQALYETVAAHHGGTPAEVRRECARLVERLR